MKTLVSFIALSLLFISGCSPTVISDVGAARTAAVQTLDAQLDLAQAQSIVETSEAEQAALEAGVHVSETENANLELALEQTQALQATFEAITPQLVAPSGANCRLGPNAGFRREAEIASGGVFDIMARNSDGDWWQVKHPDEADSTCWVFWASDLSFMGDVFSLPLIAGPSLPTNTAAPTRAPGFSLRYDINNTCSGVSYAMIIIRNTGPETYESAVVRLWDVASSTEIRSSAGNSEFLTSVTSCPKGNSNLGPGQSAYMTISLGGTRSGDLLRVSVRLCTENGFGGNCISGNTQFTR
jgi:hypothetical protein